MFRAGIFAAISLSDLSLAAKRVADGQTQTAFGATASQHFAAVGG